MAIRLFCTAMEISRLKHWTLGSGSPLLDAHAHIQRLIVLLKKIFDCVVRASYVQNLVKIGL